jgi:hypothetical protein
LEPEISMKGPSPHHNFIKSKVDSERAQLTSPRISVSHLWSVYPSYTDSAGNAVLEMSQEASSEGGAAVRRRRMQMEYQMV